MAGGATGPEATTKKLRVAFCHPDLGIGGAERLVVDAASELAQRGHEVHVFTAHHNKARCFPQTLDGTFTVRVYGDFLPRHIFHRFHALCAYIRCIWVALCMLTWHRDEFDVVFVDQVSAVIPILGWKKRVRTLFYCHFPDLLLAQHGSKWSLRAWYRAPIDWLEETTTGMADCVVVNSRFTAQTFAATFKRLAARGLQPAVLYPAVVLPSTQKISSEADTSGVGSIKKPYFLSLNRYERKKEVELAVRALSIVRGRQGASGPGPSSGVHLVVAGGYDVRLPENVEYLEELKGIASSEGISDCVQFLTSISDAQKASLLTGSLAVLYTPQNEHFGLVPLEAMAYAKPVVACNSGGPTESIADGSTGFLCEPTPINFAVAMTTLLSDPKRTAKMGLAARQRVETSFSTKTFGDTLEDLLLTL